MRWLHAPAAMQAPGAHWPRHFGWMLLGLAGEVIAVSGPSLCLRAGVGWPGNLLLVRVVAGFGLALAVAAALALSWSCWRRRVRWLVVYGWFVAGSAVLLSVSVVGFATRALVIRAGAPNASVTVSPDGRALDIEGVLGPLLPDQVRTALRWNPRVRALVVTSPGGLLDGTLRTARLIRHDGLPVEVRGLCASACVALWAASPERTITRDSRIGLHQASLAGGAEWMPVSAVESGPFQAYVALLRGAGLDQQAVARMLATPPSAVYWLSARQVVAAGVRATLVRD